MIPFLRDEGDILLRDLKRVPVIPLLSLAMRASSSSRIRSSSVSGTQSNHRESIIVKMRGMEAEKEVEREMELWAARR